MESEKSNYQLKHLTIEDIKTGCITLTGDNDQETKLCMIQEEFRQGMEIVSSLTPSVTFYGSARLAEDDHSYVKARNLAYRISKELGYTILSGGGGGIMEAVNRGAADAGGKSVGITIRLPHEQATNKYVTEEIPFYFFFTRQVVMSYTTEVCIFCAGGFGTFNELFEQLTLQQTGKIGRIPIILYGSKFWNPMDKLIKETLLERYGVISPEDLELYVITDDDDYVLRMIAESRLRDARDALK